MQARRHSADSEDHGIDLAPMLDFTINLLIFFIITTSFIKETGITVTKPEAVTAEHRDSGNLLISVRENGDIWMDRRKVELRDVRVLLERLHIERPDDTVVIIADQKARAGVVAKVMDEVRQSGIREVSIAADNGSRG
ncbi:MAG: biopolymer transporter ExbD [Rhodospirillaceae bacterium]|nr:biopolymer transporter ExbD [Rhodospirillaceae bacterium]